MQLFPRPRGGAHAPPRERGIKKKEFMTQFTMVFTTRHRDLLAVEKDCYQICDCINDYTSQYDYTYNGKELIIFHIYGANKKARIGILSLLLGHLQSITDYKSLDLQSYTNQ